MIEELVGLGFTASEARVYIALLQQPDSTGYELAKAAGLQRANAYAAVDSLVGKEAVSRVDDGAPARFVAIPPADVLGRIKRSTVRRADGLIADLAGLTGPREEASFYTLRSMEAIIDRVASLADSARHRIGVCAWRDDMDWMSSPLRAAARSGCQVVVNVFGDAQMDFGDVYRHESPERTVSGHLLTMVVDSTTAIIATLGHQPTALCTTQPAVVQVVEKLIRDEAYLAAIYERHQTELEASFGPHLVQLRSRLLPADQASHLISLVGFGADDPALHPFEKEA